MKKVLSTLTIALSALLFTVAQPAHAQIVVSDFDNTGFDVYSGPGPWNTAAVNGPSFLTIGPSAMGGGSATFTPFLNGLIPDLTGTTEFHFDLRLGAGNQVSNLEFRIGSSGSTRGWTFNSLVLNTSTFTTMVFKLDDADVVIGPDPDLANLNNIAFIGGTIAENTLDFRMEFDTLVSCHSCKVK